MILVSNIGLPSNRIGSWTTMLNAFLERNKDFDFILSPSKVEGSFLYCQKKSFIIYNRRFRQFQLKYHVAKMYLDAIQRISKTTEKLVIVVMDDPHLLEAIALNRSLFNCDIELIFSFHGHLLNISETVLLHVDRVLFLTESGYLETKYMLNKFIPQVEVIGNGIDSTIFHPLSKNEKIIARKQLGYQANDNILVWMANERPIKGMAIFKQVVKRLVKKYSNLQILIIGNKTSVILPNTRCVGRFANDEIAKYLQIGDYFMFTTLCKEGFGLSVIEALKTGNVIIASDNGGIGEVLQGLPNTYLVNKPNIVEAWVDAFDDAYNTEKEIVSIDIMNRIWSYEDWEFRFKNAIQS